MGPLAALWHLLDFLAPAVVLGCIAALASKWLWRRELRGVRWSALAAWACGAGLLVAVLGLVLSGRDGRMSTYAAMVVACAVALWWRAFVHRR